MFTHLLLAVLIGWNWSGWFQVYSPDPNRRILQLINQSERHGPIELEVERFWMEDKPSHLTPVRVYGSVGPSTDESNLAVANVLSESVQVFKVVDGELTLLAKVPPGEAVDLSVEAGTKLSATFSTAPHCVNYTVKMTTEQVWLLRPPPKPTFASPVSALPN